MNNGTNVPTHVIRLDEGDLQYAPANDQFGSLWQSFLEGDHQLATYRDNSRTAPSTLRSRRKLIDAHLSELVICLLAMGWILVGWILLR